ncbi:MAG: hypothetical protein C4336_01805 [Armatimonadota bacterium]
MNLADAIRMATRREAVLEPSPHPTPNPQSVSAHEHEQEREEVQMVRFEVRLTNQQLYDLLNWMARALHPVMTLREAAHYLRLRPTELHQMAEHGIIPAFRVDGRWRFLKAALDEWILLQRATDATPTKSEGNPNEKEEGNESAA